MAMQTSEEQGIPNQAELVADVRLSVGSNPSQSGGSVGSDPSQSGGAPEISKNVVSEPYYRPLSRAAFKGDWEFAKRFFEQDDTSRTAKITSRSETLLHIAALSGQDEFLVNLVELLSPYPEALEMVDCDDRTALHNAVLGGRIRMVKALVRSNPRLTQLRDKDGRVPLGISAREASMHKEITWFLAESTTDDEPSHPFSNPSAIETIIDLTNAGHHDITLYLVGQYPRLKTMRSTERGNRSVLEALAKSSNFRGGTRLSGLEALIYKRIPVDLKYKPTDKNSDPALQCLTRSLWNIAKIVVPIIKRVHEVKLRHVTAVELAKQVCIAISSMNTTEIANLYLGDVCLFGATARGIDDFLKLCFQFFPELIWVSPKNMKLATQAVRFRKEKSLGLFLQVSSTNELSLVRGPTQEDSANMMGAATSYYPSFDGVTNEAGAAFQMQRELQWYKAVESWVVPRTRDGYVGTKTFWTSFVIYHTDLLESGEKWMKDTSNSCMITSALIATVLFAAAFTVPGGNNDKSGVPLLLGKDSFLVFIISDVLGLFSSMTAILLFLAILTSQYEAQDFLEALPKVIMGLSFLFLSLAFMLVAFAATLTIVLEKRLVEWVLIPIILLTSIPVALFVVLQLPLLYQMVKSTYGPSIFHPNSIWE